jgi:hypothetical protein
MRLERLWVEPSYCAPLCVCDQLLLLQLRCRRCDGRGAKARFRGGASYVPPWMGLELLGTAREVAEFDLPRVLGLLSG